MPTTGSVAARPRHTRLALHQPVQHASILTISALAPEVPTMAYTADQFTDLMRSGEYQQALDYAIAAAQAAHDADDVVAEARANVWWADAARFLDDNDAALARGREAERLVTGQSDLAAQEALADALRVQADALRMLERYDEALAIAQRAESVARQAGYLRGQADALRPQSWILLNADRNDEALRAAGLAAELSRQADYPVGEANALDTMADILLKLEQREKALQAATQAAELCRGMGDRLREANALQSVTNCLREMDRNEEALEAAERAVELYLEVGDRLGQGNALRGRADALLKLGQAEDALASARQAQGLLQQVGSRMGPAASLRSQSEALRSLGRYDEAMASARQAEELFRAINYRQGQAEALVSLALSAAQAKQPEIAEAAANEARSLFVECGMPGMAGYAEYVVNTLHDAPPTQAGGRAVARLHQEYGAQLGQILASAEKAEEAWHRELRKPRQPACAPGTGEFVVLRQWPSYATLSLLPYPDEVAGGYLLRWGDQNLIVDPGLGFLVALRQAGFHLTDIDGVAITHWHIDHTGDVEEMLTSLFEANDPDMVAQLDFFLAPGAFSVYANLLAHNPGVRSVTLLRAGEHADWRNMRMTAVPAGHRDLTGRDKNTIGLRFELCGPDGACLSSVGVTSDTRWLPELVPALSGCDLVVLHLGGIYGRDLTPSDYAKNHLGVKGTAELLAALADSSAPPRLAMLSEIGKELEYERMKLCTIFEEISGCPVFPAELGMRLRLPDLRLNCDVRGCANVATRWGLDPHERKRICARCDECIEPLESHNLPF